MMNDLHRVKKQWVFSAYLFIYCSFILLSFHIGQSRSLKLGMQCNNGNVYCVRDDGLSQLICSIVLFLLSLHIGQCLNFTPKISQEL